MKRSYHVATLILAAVLFTACEKLDKKEDYNNPAYSGERAVCIAAMAHAQTHHDSMMVYVARANTYGTTPLCAVILP